MDKDIRFSCDRGYITRWIVLVFICLASVGAFSNTVKMIYGFKIAKQFSDKTPYEQYIIQAASFNSSQNAHTYSQQLRDKTDVSVQIKQTVVYGKTVYAVLIGPLSSPQAVRAVAEDLLGEKARRPLLISGTSTLAQPYVFIGGGAQSPTALGIVQVDNGSALAAPYHLDSYRTNTNSGGLFALAGGVRWLTDATYVSSYSVGLMWQSFFKHQIDGTVLQYSDPTFLNYSYQIDTASNILLAYGTLNLLQWKRFSPYLMGGIGGAWNRVSGYTESAFPNVTPRDSPAFQTNTSSQFAYLLGVGIDFVMKDFLSLSVGYQYVGLSAMSSGFGTSTWSNRRLDFGAAASNGVLVRINYYFDQSDWFHRG